MRWIAAAVTALLLRLPKSNDEFTDDQTIAHFISSPN